jgi:hypothetical protein
VHRHIQRSLVNRQVFVAGHAGKSGVK